MVRCYREQGLGSSRVLLPNSFFRRGPRKVARGSQQGGRDTSGRLVLSVCYWPVLSPSPRAAGPVASLPPLPRAGPPFSLVSISRGRAGGKNVPASTAPRARGARGAGLHLNLNFWHAGGVSHLFVFRVSWTKNKCLFEKFFLKFFASTLLLLFGHLGGRVILPSDEPYKVTEETQKREI